MNYQRIKIAGIITTLSEITVASGLIDEFKPSTKNQKKQQLLSQYSEICLDKDNKPYLPASSLRGSLSRMSSTQQSKHHIPLFGDNDSKKAGKLRMYDATWMGKNNGDKRQGDKPPKYLHSHNAINPITGTAKDQHLYHDAYVPENSEFDWLLEADQISASELEYLLALLKGLKSNPLVQLGKGQSKQRGLFRWAAKDSAKPVKILTQDDLIAWLLKPESAALSYTDTAVQVSEINVKNSRLIRYPLVFTALSPILINDRALVKDDKKEPDLEFYRHSNHQLIIPASSLIGVLRSQCRKILLTLMIANSAKTAKDEHGEENTQADDLIATLFGSTAGQSKIWLTDSVAEDTDNHEHIQNFNAIDRFTGGTADGALYTAHAASPKKISSTLRIDTRQQALEGWQKGLLVLLLRDALEADLTVGWGKSKGYGCVQLSEITLEGQQQTNWEAVKNFYGIENMQRWVDSLNDKCNIKTEQEKSHG